MSQLFFVYGTLRADAPNSAKVPAPIAKKFKTARHIGRGSVRGKLHWVSWYPGLAETRSEDRVIGDVFEFDDDMAFVKALDAYEQASVDPARNPEYLRKRKLVALRGGRKVYAWTYVYNHPHKLGQRIESGDFLREAVPV